MGVFMSLVVSVCAFTAPAILTGLLKAIRDKEKTDTWTFALMVCSVIIVTALLSL
ncbi:hypothetical protein [Sinanaerobacter sp. ZZT-01]|uniref:hypothetical protein n=1 Tax=Sinanaerobacter sp. ZZT-01 TaxID=3111540 RepID=UPI002D76F893|nr:hypothetical protein [Sinanaerobacter sp. ZZT-01]WRR92545.1 hypothetical protein U5921_10845 [Sinanaerobacter sp. ZZT-01]